jgi:hypothetical protein
MDPSRRLAGRLRFFRLLSIPIFEGISPVRKLEPKDKYVKFVRFVMEAGISPVKLFECRVSTSNDLKDPTSGAILPVNILFESPKLVNDFSWNKDSGMVEFSLFLCSLNFSK